MTNQVTDDYDSSTLDLSTLQDIAYSVATVLHYVIPKHLQIYLVAIEVLRLDIGLPFC